MNVCMSPAGTLHMVENWHHNTRPDTTLCGYTSWDMSRRGMLAQADCKRCIKIAESMVEGDRMVTVDELDDVMEFEHVIRVHEDGSISEPRDIYAPEMLGEEIGDARNRWTYFTDGYSGQHGYSGPVMHPSEFIGGDLATDILATPGVYVSVVIEHEEERCDLCNAPVVLMADGRTWQDEDGNTGEMGDHAHSCSEGEMVADGWAILTLK